jgi:taurine--2-oxoglutarate transaminase
MTDDDLVTWDRTYLLQGTGPKRLYRPLTVRDADGSWVTLADGRRLLDLHGQHMCLAIGHRHPAVVAALHRAVDGLDYVADFLAHAAKSRAAKLLIADTMDGSDWAGGIRFVNSGSEAVEMAMMLARLFTNRPIIVTRDLAFHGWTAAAAAATGLASRRNVFTTATGEIRAVPSPHGPYPAAPSPLCHNCPLGQSYPSCKDSTGTLACVRATERVIRSVGVEQVAGFLTEIWHGGGAFLPPDEYVPQIRELTARLGVLWIDDEAIGGPARTGQWWAFQHYGVEPDIVTMAKGISNAAVPVGAVVVSRSVADFLNAGWWAHSSTSSGHPLAMAAIAATVDVIIAEDLVARAADLGEFLRDRLSELAKRHPHVAAVSGRGLLWAIELVRDPDTGTRWVGADRWYSGVVDGPVQFHPGLFVALDAARRGVLLLNYAPNTVTIAPPLTISREELEFGLSAIDASLAELARHA